jgi:type IV pilus assembly protein PilF
MEIMPNDPEVYEVHALFHQSTGEYDLAEQYFRDAIKLRPNFSRARNNFAAFLYMQNRYDEAKAQLLVVTSDALYSARPQAFVNLGMCQLKLDNKDMAKDSFKKALLMDPDNDLALVELGYIAYDQGEINEAWLYFEAQRSSVTRQSSRALWLGIMVARKQGNLDSEASFSLMLKSLYPDSMEYQVYSRD